MKTDRRSNTRWVFVGFQWVSLSCCAYALSLSLSLSLSVCVCVCVAFCKSKTFTKLFCINCKSPHRCGEALLTWASAHAEMSGGGQNSEIAEIWVLIRLWLIVRCRPSLASNTAVHRKVKIQFTSSGMCVWVGCLLFLWGHGLKRYEICPSFGPREELHTSSGKIYKCIIFPEGKVIGWCHEGHINGDLWTCAIAVWLPWADLANNSNNLKSTVKDTVLLWVHGTVVLGAPYQWEAEVL